MKVLGITIDKMEAQFIDCSTPDNPFSQVIDCWVVEYRIVTIPLGIIEGKFNWTDIQADIQKIKEYLKGTFENHFEKEKPGE